jgi:hypothetical protein
MVSLCSSICCPCYVKALDSSICECDKLSKEWYEFLVSYFEIYKSSKEVNKSFISRTRTCEEKQCNSFSNIFNALNYYKIPKEKECLWLCKLTTT